jgi:hypothetical protein
MDSSTLADIAAIGTLLVAVASAAYARKEWLHKTGHWLYIPAPDEGRQNPVEPDFWVFPPVQVDEVYAVVIAGKVVNAGPSDAFSVHIYAEPEFSAEELRRYPVFETAIDTLAHRHPQKAHEDLWESFIKAYRSSTGYVPVLRVGEELPFVVVAKYDRSSRYIETIQKEEGLEKTRGWMLGDRQAHAVHAESHTITGKKCLFQPGDLCAPFEPQPAISPSETTR